MPMYKLHYFEAKGIAEPIRYLLKYLDIDFEDIRYEYSKWYDIKPTTPFGQLPVLEVDDKKAFQSLAICRYLAKKAELCGKDEWEDLEIDAVVDSVTDMRLKISQVHQEQDPIKKEESRRKVVEEVLPFYLEKLEVLAKKNGGHLAIGRLSWADFHFAGVVDCLNVIVKVDLLEGFENLKGVKKNVEGIPAVQQWIQKRPVTEF